jgi:hypothetical protein
MNSYEPDFIVSTSILPRHLPFLLKIKTLTHSLPPSFSLSLSLPLSHSLSLSLSLSGEATSKAENSAQGSSCQLPLQA